jgi:hypothetical protein
MRQSVVSRSLIAKDKSFCAWEGRSWNWKVFPTNGDRGLATGVNAPTFFPLYLQSHHSLLGQRVAAAAQPALVRFVTIHDGLG